MADGTSHIHPEYIDEYYRLLEGSDDASFYTHVVTMAQSEPYFFGPYLELADYLEVKNMNAERVSLLAFACRVAEDLLSNTALMNEARDKWTKREGQLLADVIERAKQSGVSTPALLLMRARRFYSSLRDAPVSQRKNLALINKIPDVVRIRDEIARNEVCWIYNTARQENIAAHRDTNAIILRIMQGRDEKFTAIDGPHESVVTPFAKVFPHTFETIEKFAKDMRGGLGRVALVRLKPHSMVYRHHDGEIWLTGRNRYHLVIQSPSGSFMTSGSETQVFNEGDLFLFNNKVMHTAENRSDTWRIHAIFDMKVPKDTGP